ncbi:non-ribosomal peptide synthetase, partial [Piscinibacter terrae]
MKLTELVDALAERSIQLRRDGDELVVRADAGKVEPHLVPGLREHKNALLGMLSRHGGDWWDPGARITPEMLPLVQLTQAQIDGIAGATPGGAANIQDIYPLAPLQEGILFHHRMVRTRDPYLQHALYGFQTRERLDEYAAALQAVIDRHDILRTAIHWEGLPDPVQVVQRRSALVVTEVGIDVDGADAVEQLRARFDPRHFRLDIREAPMLRLFVAHDAANGRWLSLMLFHHLCVDHTTIEVIQDEVAAFMLGQTGQLPTPLPFRNFVAQARLGVAMEEHEAFFREMLADVDEPTTPYGLVDVQGDGRGIAEFRREVDSPLARRLRERARALGVSAASLFHVAWAQVLARVSGRDDVVFGTLMLGRMQGGSGADRVLGLFINTLPVRIHVGDDSAPASVRRTHALLTRLLRHEHAPLALAQRCSAVAAPAPLFSALLNYRHTTQPQAGSARNTLGIEFLGGEERTNYPFTLSVDDLGEGFTLTAQVQAPAQPQRVCELMHTALEQLVLALESTSDAALRSLDVMPAAERHEQLVSWNETQADYPSGECLHWLVEAHARTQPQAPAVVHGERALDYAQLNAQANRLAHHLLGLGVKPGQRVAILMARSIEIVVAELAVLKCAAVFVTLDQNAPDERQAFIVRDCEAQVVLCAAGLALPVMDGVQRCDVEDLPWDALPSHDPQLPMDSEAPAHVTYTSGSTGNPKGVVVPHRAIGRVSLNNGYADFRPSDRFAYVSNPAWDANTLEVWVPLLNGMCVVVFDQDEVLSPQRLREGLIRHRVNAAWLTVGLFNQYADVLADVFGQLRFLLVGGDALDPRIVAKVLRSNPPQNLINGYGPTETTVFAATHRLTEVPEGAHSIPIGRPIANTRIYLLDRHLRPVPTGVVGEICIGGAGLACGYLHQPELTAERFVADPFRPGELMYRSGDLGRRLADGNIDFAGRNDFQVKVRGFRIELGEIEARLGEHPAIGEMAVLVREDEPGRKRIVAYYTSDDVALDAKTLREHLMPRLPDYMLPAAYVRLAALPLTINGKLDRRALPAPDDAAIAASGYEAPVGEVEATLARIWAEELKLDRVGRNDNFFELGGHSLLAVRVIERMRQAGVSADVRVMFSAPTLSALAQSVGGEHAAAAVPPNGIVPGCDTITPDMLPLVALDDAEIARIVDRVPGGAANVQDIYPLAPLQEGILFHHLLVKQGDPYLLHALLAFDSRERIERHVGALQHVVDRHDILRTAVHWEGVREPVQVVWRNAPLAIEEVALDTADGDVAGQLLARFDPRRHRIDIRQAPLLRIVVAHDAANSRWVMLQLFHHLAIDHTALEQAHAEVRAVLLGQGEQLPEPLPFRNFVAQTRLNVDAEEREAFFRSMLHDVQEPTAPFGLVDARGDGDRLGEARLRLAQGLAGRLRSKARAWGVGAASVCHLAWAMVLARLSGRDDVVFGTVLFGRMQGGEGADRALGLFINTLPLRVGLDQLSVADGVRRVQALLAGLMRHEHASLAMAQRCSGVKAPLPLFSSLLNYRHTTSVNDEAANEAWEGMEYLSSAERTNYPLALSVDDLGEGFELVAQAVAPVDAARVCAYMNEALAGLVTAMESAPDMPLQAIDLLPSAERERMLVTWNATQSVIETGRCVHELIEAQAWQRGASVAVSCEGQALSYAELDAQANQLAHHLRRLGVGAEQRVAVCMQRSVQMVVALLAVWKAGGAYVPLDPAYPQARLAHMMGDSAPRALLTDRAVRERLPALDVPVIELDAVQRAWERESRDPVDSGVTPSNLAYVIYTSGSTGQPKGVMVEHRHLANLIGWHCQAFELKVGDRASSVAGFGFDAVVWEMWPALSVGAQLCMPGPQCGQDPQALLAWWEQEALDVSFLPTPIAEHAFATGHGHRTLRRLLIGGDRLRQMPARALGFELVNNYGPTEATVVATSGVLQPGVPVLHIGRPIANTAIYLLDEHRRPVPQGVAGELYIGGAQVARGYLNQPQLTSERFVSDPFAGAGARMYRTGDLARYLEDGSIEFLGRNDAQVKVRGVRIELGEIEAALLAHEAVSQAVVVAREDAGETRLVAYCTAPEGVVLEAAQLKQWLQRTLAQHMLPQAVVQLAALPLTANGKIDRQALPAPQDGADPSRAYEAPVGDTEARLAQIWAEVLRVERVGRHDNFFELGGHSLSAVSMSSRAAQSFGVQIDLANLFAHPVLSDLAAHLQSAGRSELPPLTRCRRDAPIPASFAQQRLWYLATMEGASHAYHVPLALRLKGVLDRAVLRRAFDRIVARHEALRTTFDMVDGRLMQRIAPQDMAHVALRESRLDRHADAEAELSRLSMEEASAPFDLETGPLMRARLVVLGNEEHVLLLTLHHIVSDGWSIGVLVDELGALYAAYAQGREDPLPPLAIQYADHAAWQRGWLAGPAGEERAAYWREALAGAPVLLTLPTDRPRPARQDHAGASVPVVLDATLSAELRAFSQRHGVSLFMTLLAAWAIVMGRCAGQQDVVIGTPSANRRGQDIEKLIGFFVNTLAVRLDLGGHPSVAQFLAHVKTQALDSQACEDLPFEQVVELVNPARSTSHTPLFQVTFTWQGGQPVTLDLPGLTLEPVAHGHEAAKYDLSLLLAESGEQITGGLVYASALFERETVERFVGYLHHALRAMLDDEAETLDELELLSERERERQLVQWNATETEYPRHAGVHELFEAQAHHSPKTVAVVDLQGEVSY